MATENRIIKVEIEINTEGNFEVRVTKEFAPEYGGGTQVFLEPGGSSLHRALDVARGMVTLSPGRRTDLPDGSFYEYGPVGTADFEPNPGTNRRQS